MSIQQKKSEILASCGLDAFFGHDASGPGGRIILKYSEKYEREAAMKLDNSSRAEYYAHEHVLAAEAASLIRAHVEAKQAELEEALKRVATYKHMVDDGLSFLDEMISTAAIGPVSPEHYTIENIDRLCERIAFKTDPLDRIRRLTKLESYKVIKTIKNKTVLSTLLKHANKGELHFNDAFKGNDASKGILSKHESLLHKGTNFCDKVMYGTRWNIPSLQGLVALYFDVPDFGRESQYTKFKFDPREKVEEHPWTLEAHPRKSTGSARKSKRSRRKSKKSAQKSAGVAAFVDPGTSLEAPVAQQGNERFESRITPPQVSAAPVSQGSHSMSQQS